MKINKFLLLSLLLTGCGSTNVSSSSETRQSLQISTSSSEVVTSSTSSSSSEEEIIFGTGSSSTKEDNGNQGNNGACDHFIEIDNSKNLIEMDRVLNLQCSKGTEYGIQHCTDGGADDGSFYADWEGWWVEYTQVGDYGVDIKSPEGCDYSGDAAWKVQLSIPSNKFDGEKEYVLAFDFEGHISLTSDQAPIKNPICDISFFNPGNNAEIFRVGSLYLDTPVMKHFEYRFKTYTGSIVGKENHISFMLGGRGALDYKFHNLYLAEI